MDDNEFIRELFEFKDILKLVKARMKASNDVGLKKDKIISENAREAGNKLYTQKNHDQQIHTDTLLQYTKSIAFAPKESEELALGYSNRSALLMHLCRYNECLTDINRALDITKSDQLKSKLESRREKCLLSISEKKATEKRQLVFPDIVTSPKIPCAAAFVSIGYNESCKHHLIATRDIKPGEIIIAEKAYACCPEIAQIYLVCSHCLSFAWNGISCDCCAYSIYCNEICKKAAWEEYHDIECTLIALIFSFFDLLIDDQIVLMEKFRSVILPTRIFIKAVKAEGFENIMDETELMDSGTLDLLADGTIDNNKFGYLYNLHSGPQKQISRVQDCFSEALVLYLLIKHTNLIPIPKKCKDFNSNDKRMLLRLRDILVKLKSITNANGFSYHWNKCTHQDFLDCQTKCSSYRGTLIAPCSGIINHSCLPNVHRFTLPLPKIIIYAAKPIKKGEQLFISFGPSFQTNATERKIYLEKMHYTCRCIACTDKSFKPTIDEKTFDLKYKKIQCEFRKIFGKNAINDFFNDSDPTKWSVFTQASLKQAFKLNELYFKYFEFNEAWAFIGPVHFYIRKAFDMLYGEKCDILSQC